MLAHFKLALFILILNLQSSIFPLFRKKFALCVSTLLWTGHVTEYMAIFTRDWNFLVFESLLFTTCKRFLSIWLDFLQSFTHRRNCPVSPNHLQLVCRFQAIDPPHIGRQSFPSCQRKYILAVWLNVGLS